MHSLLFSRLIKHANGDVQWALGNVSLEFGGEVGAGDEIWGSSASDSI